MKKFYLILIVAMCTLQLSAQDKVTLKWQVDDVTEPKVVYCITNGILKINWGDGGIEETFTSGILSHLYETQGENDVTITAADDTTKFYHLLCAEQQVSKLEFFGCTSLVTVWCYNNQLKNLDFSGCSNLIVLQCGNNQITHLNVSNCAFLTDLSCNNNQLETINISDCVSLTEFICNDNQISNIDLSNCLVLEYLDFENNKLSDLNISNNNVLDFLSCSNNQLKLSTLYAAQLKMGNAGNFGTQYLPVLSANTNTELFEDQSVFAGVFTNYTVEIDGEIAPESSYTVTDGKLTFLKDGKYTVTMTNDMVGYSYSPAKVIVPVEVTQVGVHEINLFDITVYPNPTTGELRIENGELTIINVEVYDIYGRNITPHTSYLLPHTSFDLSNEAAGVYFVKIQSESGIVTKKIIKH